MTTIKLSRTQAAASRNMQSLILTAVAESKQVNVAKAIGVDSSTVGRWLDSKNADSKVVQFCDILAYCGLKIVPEHIKYYDEKKIEAVLQVAKFYFQDLHSANDLLGEAGERDVSPINPEIRFSRRINAVADSDVSADSAFDLLAMVIAAAAKAPREIELARIVPASDSKPVPAYGYEDALKDEIEAKIQRALYIAAGFIVCLCVLAVGSIAIFGQ